MDNSDYNSELNNPMIASVIAYFAFIGLIIAFFLNRPRQELITFHLRQSLGIYLLFVAAGFIMVIPILGWIVGIVGILLGILLWIIGLVDALQGRMNPVPVLGERFQEWFAGL